MLLYIMFTYPRLLISYVYCTLYHLLHLAYAVEAIAHPYIYMYIFLFIPYTCVYKVVDVKLLDYLIDITARSELEAQAFRYTRINHC